MTGIQITTEPTAPGVTTITAAGELDVATAHLLRQQLIEVFVAGGPGERLVIDLTGITFLDSTGLGVLVGAHKRCLARGASMTVVASDFAARVMRLTGLDALWDLQAAGEP